MKESKLRKNYCHLQAYLARTGLKERVQPKENSYKILKQIRLYMLAKLEHLLHCQYVNKIPNCHLDFLLYWMRPYPVQEN